MEKIENIEDIILKEFKYHKFNYIRDGCLEFIKSLIKTSKFSTLSKMTCYGVLLIINKQCQQFQEGTQCKVDESNVKYDKPRRDILSTLDLPINECIETMNYVINDPVYVTKECYEEEITLKHDNIVLKKTDSKPFIRKEIVFNVIHVQRIFNALKNLFYDTSFVKIPYNTRIRFNANKNIVDLKGVLSKNILKVRSGVFSAKKSIEIDITNDLPFFDAWNLFIVTGVCITKLTFDEVASINEAVRICISDKTNSQFEFELEKLEENSVYALNVILEHYLNKHVLEILDEYDIKRSFNK